jgi:hypothetical protein
MEREINKRSIPSRAKGFWKGPEAIEPYSNDVVWLNDWLKIQINVKIV